MSTFSELNQANNRNGDLLTEISKLQQENAELAKENAKLLARVNALEHIINLRIYEATQNALAMEQEKNERLAAQLNEWLEWDANSDRVPRPDSDRVPRPSNEIRPQSDTLPEHQDPSKWVSKEDMEQAHGTEPVAWRVRDFGDSWILYKSGQWARKHAENTGNLIQPLYTVPSRADASELIITDEQIDAASDAYEAEERRDGTIGDCLRAAIMAARSAK